MGVYKVQQLCGVGKQPCKIDSSSSSGSGREPTCVQQLCGVGKAAMQGMLATAAVGSPQGTPAMWGR